MAGRSLWNVHSGNNNSNGGSAIFKATPHVVCIPAYWKRKQLRESHLESLKLLGLEGAHTTFTDIPLSRTQSMDMSHCRGRMKIQSSYVLRENASLVNGQPILSHLWEVHVQGGDSVSFFLLFFSIVSFRWRCAKLTLYEPEYQIVITHS